MESKPRDILVVWSGGYDSTWLLLDLLNAYTGRENVSIYTVYIELENNVNKSAAEKRQRELMKQILLDEKNGYSGIYKGDICPQPSVRINGCDFSGYQWVLFAALLRFWIRDHQRHFDEIHFGFKQGDDFWSFKPTFVDIFRGIPIIEHYDESYSSKSLLRFIDEPELHFPLQFVFKRNIFELLKADKVGKKLFDLIWTCELPRCDEENDTYLPCGECPACRTKWEYEALVTAYDQQHLARIRALDAELPWYKRLLNRIKPKH